MIITRISNSHKRQGFLLIVEFAMIMTFFIPIADKPNEHEKLIGCLAFSILHNDTFGQIKVFIIFHALQILLYFLYVSGVFLHLFVKVGFDQYHH